MQMRKTLATAGLLALMGGMAACGGGSSSSPDAAGSSDGPADATKATFCSTFSKMSDSTTPKDASTQLIAVGTPADIDASSRHGFEVLVEHLGTLPDGASSSDLDAMQKSLSATDQKDVLAFGTYLTKECVPTGSTTPSSPSS